jgi:hypothetical protein
VVVVFAASPAESAGILPGGNPARNIAPHPNFMAAGACTKDSDGWSCTNPCVTPALSFPSYTNSPKCIAFVLRAINHARRREGVRRMTLPRDFQQLSVAEQLFVLANLERTARGLPPYLGLNTDLVSEAQHAANQGGDPSLAPGFAVGVDAQGYYGMGGAWSSGFSPLTADYFWMYDDGWGGRAHTFNVACTSAGAPACWAHRDQLLGYDPRFNPGVGLRCQNCEMGTGFTIAGASSSYVDLVELPAGTAPTMTFTWEDNVLPFLSRHLRSHPVAHPVARRHRVHHHRVHHARNTANARAAARRAERDAMWAQWAPPATQPSRVCTISRPTHTLPRLGCRNTTFTVRQLAGPTNREER